MVFEHWGANLLVKLQISMLHQVEDDAVSQ